MRRTVVAGVVALGLVGAACSPSAPEVPLGPDGQPDAVLATGRDVYQSSCVQCHGGSGAGGRGPRLNDGEVLTNFPDIADEIAIVVNGKGGMPAYSDKLTPDEIEAVVRYTREVLDDTR